MLLVGLTGGFGSGKSTVASMLEQDGLTVISADSLAREVCEPGTEAFKEIVQTFGQELVAEDGSLDRKRLGEVVFASSVLLLQLNHIVHPRVIARESELVEEFEKSNPHGILVLDVPLLIEAERHHLVDFVVVVNAPAELRFERLKRRFGNLDRAAVEARMKHQLPLEEKVKLADFVIDNGGDLASTREQVTELVGQLKRLSSEKQQTSITH